MARAHLRLPRLRQYEVFPASGVVLGNAGSFLEKRPPVLGVPFRDSRLFLGFGLSVTQVALVTHVSEEVENWAKCLNTLASVAHDLGAQVIAALRAHAGQLVC